MKESVANSSTRSGLSAREQLVALVRKLDDLGLNRGTSGNCSVRSERGLFITPSGTDVERLSPDAIVEMNLRGETLSGGEPSSEWRFHRDIMLAKPEVNAIVHAHSSYATSLSCFREDVPAFHYMIAVAGGNSIKCSSYALFGSQSLSDNVLLALVDRKACLMSNHGMIATGKNLNSALTLAIEVENLCHQYLMALQVGQPVLLNEQEMSDVQKKFLGYGDWSEP